MGGVVSAIFGGGGGEPAERGPTAAEIAAEEDEKRRKAIKAAKQRNRIKATGAGVGSRQTLFARAGAIPRPKKLGGDVRA